MKYILTTAIILMGTTAFAEFPEVLFNNEEAPGDVIEILGDFPLDDSPPAEVLLKTTRGYEVVANLKDDDYSVEYTVFISKEKPKLLESQANGFYDIEADGRLWKHVGDGGGFPTRYSAFYMPFIAPLNDGKTIDFDTFVAVNNAIGVDIDKSEIERMFEGNLSNTTYVIGGGYELYIPNGPYYYSQGGAFFDAVILKDGKPVKAISVAPSETFFDNTSSSFGVSPDGKYFEYTLSGTLYRIDLNDDLKESKYELGGELQPRSVYHVWSEEVADEY